jgi:hypothetical protein
MVNSRSIGGGNLSIYKNLNKDSVIQSSEKIIDEEDYPKPQTVQESQFEWPPRDAKSIMSHLKLNNAGYQYSNNNTTAENVANNYCNQDDNVSIQTMSCKRLDIPPHYGAYSNK